MPNYRRLFVQNSYLFLTLVTSKRLPILIDNINLLYKSFRDAKNIYNFEIYSFVIMPEHMHFVLIPSDVMQYPKIVRAVKYNFTKILKDGGIAIPPYAENELRSRAGLLSCQHYKIWQPRYYEHTIRDDEDLHRHLDYIHYNPVKHGLVNSVKDWKYSSFNKFVKKGNYNEDWGTIKDVEKIANLVYE